MAMVAVIGVAVVIGLVAVIALIVSDQQRRMRGGAPDLRRADQPQPPFSDYGSDMG